MECLSHPELLNKPVAVAGNPEARHGIILAKNEKAKAMGVRTGEPIWQARQKCPGIVFLPPHYELYEKYSRLVQRIYLDYTDMIEPFGMDECWLDVTGSVGLFGDGRAIADSIRERVKKELGLTVSVGVSFNKVFAKLGSDMKKPDATTVINEDDFRDKVWCLPASDMLFVGGKTFDKLRKIGLMTIGDVARLDKTVMKGLLGKNGILLHDYANGLDMSPVAVYGDAPPPKSIGNSTTTYRDLTERDDLDIVLYRLCESVSSRMRRERAVCCTVQLYVRYKDLVGVERQMPLEYPNRTARSLYDTAWKLIRKHDLLYAPIRSLGVRGCDLIRDADEQLSFMPEICKIQRAELMENTVDALREKYGYKAIVRGIMLTDGMLAGDDHGFTNPFGHPQRRSVNA